jgi:hypothetical protein
MDGGHDSGGNLRCLLTYPDRITLLLTKGTPPPETTSWSAPPDTPPNTERPRHRPGRKWRQSCSAW